MSTIVSQQSVAAGTWKLDPVHSTVSFAVPYTVATFRGGFGQVEATLTGGDEPKLEGAAKVASVVSQDPNLTGHLQAPDFFDVERFPELKFRSKAFRFEGEQLVVDGELELRGVSKPVELRGTITAPGEDAYGEARIVRLGLTLETTVDRTQFGLDWNRPLADGEPALGNDVTLTAELSFVQES